MRKAFYRLAALSLAVPVVLSGFPAASAQEDAGGIVTRENSRRQLQLQDAMMQVQEARTAYENKRYTDAEEHYRNALAVIPKVEATEQHVQFIKDSLSDALIAKAIDYRSVGRTEEAISFLKEAVQLSPANTRAKGELAMTADPQRTNPALTPQHVGNVEEVERLLTLAYGHLDLGKYDEAEQAFRQVSKIDAYNIAAQRGLETVNKYRARYNKSSRDQARAKAMEDVDATWDDEHLEQGVAPLPIDTDVAKAGSVTSEANGGLIVEDEVEEARVSHALDDMRLPHMVFDEAGILDVVDALQAQVKRYERENPTGGRSINITTDFGPVGSPGYNAIMEKRVTLNLTDVSLRKMLDLLSRQLGLSYYLTPLGVELAYSGRDFGPMVERVYSVPPHFFDQSENEGEEPSDDDFTTASTRMVVKRMNPVKVLKDMGISFPEGSNARYDSNNRRLTVRNTVHNQEEIENLIATPLKDNNNSVILNVVAVEVSETDLKELGFDWLINMNVSPNGNSILSGAGAKTLSQLTGLPMASLGGSDNIPDNATPDPNIPVIGGLRSGNEAIDSSSMDRLIERGSVGDFDKTMRDKPKAPGILTVRGVWGAGDVAVIMRGLDQKKDADIMDNPKMIFTPGMEEQVVFANVREMYYPESYEAPQISSSSANMGNNNNGLGGLGGGRNGQMQSTMATGAHPDSFLRFGMSEDAVGGVGSILQVHSAEVSEDGQSITIALTVTVNEFEGFVNWGSPIDSYMWAPGAGLNANGNPNQQLTSFRLTENRILQPIFKRRMENTKITLLPGSVVVIGGLQESKMVRFEDKLPILGDLPLVGRLFRSEGQESTRRALIFFAKVDVVDPTGKNPNTGETPGSFFASQN
ncbi:MAG: hypothetical protein Q4E43_02810 [Akkermansia sp.]|nr:hypothetical protein [Akkermansia sp.]